VSILVDQHTRLVVQGLTGREGGFHAGQMAAYGTKIVAGVTPGRGGEFLTRFAKLSRRRAQTPAASSFLQRGPQTR
jgi:succinyl-CoA synthetase alpha subunit